MRALDAVVAALTIAGCGMAERTAVRDAPVRGHQISCSFAVGYQTLGPAAARRRQNSSPTISTGNAYLVYLTPLRLRRNRPAAARRFLGRRRPSGQLHPHRHAAERPKRAVVRAPDERCGDVTAAANLDRRRPQQLSRTDLRGLYGI
jgi:hypothetical protein